MRKIITLSIVFLQSLFWSNIFSQDIPEPLSPPRLVNDFANFLNTGERENLEQKLLKFNFETSTQIYIVIVKNLYGYDISDFAQRLGEEWNVGQKEFDNGIVILVKPKTSESKGEVFIATGYGLEGVVPDAIANRIVDKEIIPLFRQEEYYSGLNAATNTLISLTKGEYTAKEYYESTKRPSGSMGIFGIVLLIFIFSIFGRMRRARHYSMGHGIPFWIAMSMLGSGGRSHGSGFGNFSSGSGGFGGFSGGGGGSFGGGGAGGSW